MSALSLTLLRFAGLLALFAATAILVQYAMNTVLTRQFAQHAINRRLKLLRSGVAREEITGLIRPDAVGGLGRYPLVGRFFRIVPLYMVGFTISLAAIGATTLYFVRSWPFSPSSVAIHYVPGLRDILWSRNIDGIVWTLEIEMKFYVICALFAVWYLRWAILRPST